MTELDVKIHSENERGDIFTLLRRVKFYWRSAAFTVPAGFESDGAGGVFRRGHKQHHDRHQHC